MSLNGDMAGDPGTTTSLPDHEVREYCDSTCGMYSGERFPADADHRVQLIVWSGSSDHCRAWPGCRGNWTFRSSNRKRQRQPQLPLSSWFASAAAAAAPLRWLQATAAPPPPRPRSSPAPYRWRSPDQRRHPCHRRPPRIPPAHPHRNPDPRRPAARPCRHRGCRR